ncbi:hypothetical protein V2J09_015082 [Rumex salicifolius]
MFSNKQKKSQIAKGNRILITVNFLGSAGPMRFVVYEGELVANVIDMALKSYAREGRLPILGSILNNFVLYCPAAGSDALSQWETIGAHGSRNFIICKKPQPAEELGSGAGATTPAKEGGSSPPTDSKKGSGSWKAWINKSLSFKIASH